MGVAVVGNVRHSKHLKPFLGICAGGCWVRGSRIDWATRVRTVAVGLHASGRVPVLDDQCWQELRDSSAGILKFAGLADRELCAVPQYVPWCQLRAGLKVFLIEVAGTRILGLHGIQCTVLVG